MRDFILNHPDYKHDSIITPLVSYDLMHMLTLLESHEASDESESVRQSLLREYS